METRPKIQRYSSLNCSHSVLQHIYRSFIRMIQNAFIMRLLKLSAAILHVFLNMPLCQDLLKNELREVQLPTFICKVVNARDNITH